MTDLAPFDLSRQCPKCTGCNWSYLYRDQWLAKHGHGLEVSAMGCLTLTCQRCGFVLFTYTADNSIEEQAQQEVEALLAGRV